MDSPAANRSEDLESGLERLEHLLGQVEEMPAPAGDVAREAVAALAFVYGEALARVVEACGGEPLIVDRLVADPLLDHLLALHGVHPRTVEQRVEHAISEMHARLHDDGSLHLQGVDRGVARVTVPTGGCGSPSLGPTVRDILLAAAPELTDVETAPAPAAPAFIPVAAIRKRAGP